MRCRVGKLFLVLGIAAVIVWAGIAGFVWWDMGKSVEEESARVSFTVSGNRTVNVTCEVSSTQAELDQGLSGRATLANGTGMLFVFPTSQNQTFWMKGMLVPIDIIFINESGRVVKVAQAPIEPGVPDSQLTRYHSGGEVKWVVETVKGFSSSNGIAPGTLIEITYL